MPRGRKPQPTPLKILSGARPDRVNHAEPNCPPSRPFRPAHLDGDHAACVEWDRLLPDLEAAGILSQIDGPALALYCAAFSRYIQSEKEVATHGLLIETASGGLKANPAVTMARECRTEMMRLLAEFGCTPSSRSRVKTSLNEKPKDLLSEFIAKKRG